MNLEWLRAPNEFTKLVQSFYLQSRSTVDAYDEGVLRGCPLSPLLSATFMKVWVTFVANGVVPIQIHCFHCGQEPWHVSLSQWPAAS